VALAEIGVEFRPVPEALNVTAASDCGE
jgi:hypothetical protein